MNDHDLKRNASGCNDPTPYKAIKHIEQTEEEVRYYKLLHTLFHVCELGGFEVEGRIQLKDKKTGRIWR